MNTLEIELTDTFQGEANYSWVKKLKITVPPNASERTIVSRAKAALDMQGLRCYKVVYGDFIALYPKGYCLVLFIYLPQ
jgi:hypothetical protein